MGWRVFGAIYVAGESDERVSPPEMNMGDCADGSS